jgi:broad specificity phosphatase PhoE
MGQRINAPLDEKGLDQARLVIPKIPADAGIIYSSPLKRALQTAQIIADHLQLHVEATQDLAERDFGSLSGKTWDEIDKESGQPLSEKDKNLEYDYQTYGGESVEQVRARLLNFIQHIKSKHSDTVVAVTHFGIISLMNKMFPHIGHHKLENISVHEFEI